MKHIVIASHDGNMFMRVGVEIALGDFSFRSTQQIYYHLDALLPAVRSGEDHDSSDLKAMLICCIDVFEPFFYCLDWLTDIFRRSGRGQGCSLGEKSQVFWHCDVSLHVWQRQYFLQPDFSPHDEHNFFFEGLKFMFDWGVVQNDLFLGERLLKL